MTEPVTLSDIKTHLRLDQSATGEDSYLSDLIMAARRACETQINRSVVGVVGIVTLDEFPMSAAQSLLVIPDVAPLRGALDIELPGGTVASVTSVVYLDNADVTLTLDPSEYATALAEIPARVAPIGAWPVASDRPLSVAITYVISPIDADDLAVVRHAIRLLVGNWYANREAAVIDTRGVPSELPLSVTWLLRPLFQFSTS